MPTKLSKITDEELVSLAKTAKSVSDLLRLLVLNAGGGHWRALKKRLEELGIDIRNKAHKGISSGPNQNRKISTQDILDGKHPEFQTNKLRNRLLKERIFEHKCCKCELATWNDQPIPLELHHISGNRSDHRQSNLKLLCPNCHAQTNTYRGKNKRSCGEIGETRRT